MIQKTYFLILLFVLFVVSYGCTSRQIENEMYGSWYIFRIRVDGDPCVYYTNFTSQFMEISKAGSIEFPAFHVEENTNIGRDKRGQWELFVNDGKTYFQIKSDDSVFSGLFRMKFLYNPDNKRLFLELTSEEVYILAARSPTNDVRDIFSPTMRDSKENRLKAIVRLSGGNFVNYEYAPFDTCPNLDKETILIYL